MIQEGGPEMYCHHRKILIARFSMLALVAAAGFLWVLPAGSQTYDWQQSQGPAGGPVWDLAVAPNGDIYAGLWFSGGVFHSSDNGVTWQDTGLQTTTVPDLVVNGTGSVFAAALDGKIYRLLSGGSAWEASAADLVGTYGCLAYDPDRDILYAARSEKVSRSIDGGESWQQVSTNFPAVQTQALAVVPNGGPLFAGTDQNKVFRSVDGGVTWTAFAAGLSVNGIHDLLIVPPNDIFAATYGGKIYKSEWDGTSWTNLACNGLDDSFCQALGLDDAGRLWAATVQSGTYVSSDGGLNWTPARAGIGLRDVTDLLFLNAIEFLAAGNGGGIFRSSDAGATWAPSSTGINRAHINDLQFGGGANYAAVSENGIHRTDDGGATWYPINAGIDDPDVLTLARHPDGTLFAGTWRTHVYKSADGGTTWSRTGATPSIQRAGRLAVHPVTGDLFVAGMFSGGVWRSSDKGDSWTDVSGNLPFGDIQFLMVEDDGDLVACGYYDGIYRSQDGGVSWNALNNGLPNTNVRQMTSLPGGTMFAAIPYHGLFRSQNDGASWELVDASLNDLRIQAVAVNSSGFIFAGSSNYGKLYQSSDGGDSWTWVSDLLPGAAITALDFDADERLLAGTNTMGVIYSQQTTPVYLRNFTAERLVDGQVEVRWFAFIGGTDVTAEVYRSTADGPREKLSRQSSDEGPTFTCVDTAAPAVRCDYWLCMTDPFGVSSWYGPVNVDKTPVVSRGLVIDAVWPNPASGSATIRFSVPPRESASLEIFDLRGHRVRRLMQDVRGTGFLKAAWDAQNDQGRPVASGTYFLRLRAQSGEVTRKIVISGHRR